MLDYKPDTLCTGSEFVSLPKIRTIDCGIYSVGFVSELLRGCVELQGSARTPLIAPFVEVESENILQCDKTASLLNYWIPHFQVQNGALSIDYTVATSVERRGFAALMEIANTSDQSITCRAGWYGHWCESVISAGQTKKIHATKTLFSRTAEPASVVLELVGNTPMLALSLLSSDCNNTTLFAENGSSDAPDSYTMNCELVLGPGEKKQLSLCVGVGLEEISAAAAAREIALQRASKIIASMQEWLEEHTIHSDSAITKHVLNVNSFYNFFYSQAITLDTEQYVLMASRNSSSSSCGIYKDRDAMRWSLPAVLQISWPNARRMLLYALTKQFKNIGLHSKFIDGIVMEPGIQLDQLCAPIRALDTYVDVTDDLSLLFDIQVQSAINKVHKTLADLRHPTEALFETLLGPSGEYSRLPYVCYSNVLVCRILEDIAVLYSKIRDLDRTDDALQLSHSVRESILKNFIVEGPFGPMFAHSIDLEGNYELHDEVAGSLIMLSYLSFCKPDDPVYLNTVKWILSEHNPDCAVHNLNCTPENECGYSVLGASNQMLAGIGSELLEYICSARLDDGLASNWIDRASGKAMNGCANAGSAGHLAFALVKTLEVSLPQTAVVEPKKESSPYESLYHPPPKAKKRARKARL